MLYEEKIIETIPVGPFRPYSFKELHRSWKKGGRLSGRVEKRERKRT